MFVDRLKTTLASKTRRRRIASRDVATRIPKFSSLRVEILEDRSLLSSGAQGDSTTLSNALSSSSTLEPNVVFVTTLADRTDPNDGATSLREAIGAASSGDVVAFDPSLAGGTITLNGTQGGTIQITKSLTITAQGLSSLTISGNNNYRIFQISARASVQLVGLTFTDGDQGQSGSTYSQGGAIYSNGATLTVSGCVFSGNASGTGGAVYVSNGSCKFERTSFIGNSCYNQGGGAFIIGCSSAVFDNCQITDNSAKTGNRQGAGLYLSGGSAVVRNCTISGNVAGLRGGGIYVDGCSLTLQNTILAENKGALGTEDFYQVQAVSTTKAYRTLSGYRWSQGADNYVYDKKTISIFADASNGNYSLAADSFAINAGDVAYVELTRDLVGNERIVGDSVDLGAREFVGGGGFLSTPRVQAVSTTSSIELSWRAVSGATSYIVGYRKSGDACYTLTSTTKTNFVLADLPEGAEYSLSVRATSATGGRSSSAFSEIVTLSAHEERTALESPKILTATATETTITIAWSAVPEATKYRAAYALNESVLFDEFVVSKNATSYTFRDLTPDTIYVVKVCAEGDGDATETSAYSDSLMISTLSDSSLTRLETPEIISTSSSKTSFTIRWSTVPNASKYQVSYAYSGSVSYATDTISSLKTSFTKTGLPTGRTFKISVRAIGDDISYASSANSEFVYLTTSGTLEPASLVVTTLSDVSANDGATSLREAIESATDGDVVTFSPQLNNGVVELSRQLLIDKSITINASASGSLTIKASEGSRVMTITGSGVSVGLLGLTLTGGSAELGGGVYASNATVSFMNCVIMGNRAEYGGGIYVIGSNSCEFVNCAICDNESTSQGGGLFLARGQARLSNCEISNNASKRGGGAYLNENSSVFINCTVSGNSATTGAGVYWRDKTGTSLAFRNTILAANNGTDFDRYQTLLGKMGVLQASRTLSSYEGWSGGENYLYNSSLPLFKNASAGDYALSSDSVALDAGDASYSTEETDLLGANRVQNLEIDLGAYESKSVRRQLDAPSFFETGTSIRWESVERASRYLVAYSLEGSSIYSLAVTSEPEFSFVGYSNGTRFVVKARALGNEYNCAPSPFTYEVRATIGATAEISPLPSPVIIDYVASSDQITISWNEVSGASGYCVAYALEGDAFVSETVSKSTTSRTFSRLNPNATYQFKVRAIGDGIASLNSAYSLVVSISPLKSAQECVPTFVCAATPLIEGVALRLDLRTYRGEGAPVESLIVDWGDGTPPTQCVGDVRRVYLGHIYASVNARTVYTITATAFGGMGRGAGESCEIATFAPSVAASALSSSIYDSEEEERLTTFLETLWAPSVAEKRTVRNTSDCDSLPNNVDANESKTISFSSAVNSLDSQTRQTNSAKLGDAFSTIDTTLSESALRSRLAIAFVEDAEEWDSWDAILALITEQRR